MPTYLSLQEAAKLSGIAPADLEMLYRQGHVPGAECGEDGRWTIAQADFEAWLADRL